MHQDPTVDPNLMGWGDLGLSDAYRLKAEAKSQDGIPVICGASEASESKMNPKLEAKIKAQFKFDEGWDFMVAERMVCGFEEGKCWMISQNIGNCVGASHCGLLVARYSHEILCLGDAEEPLGKGVLAAPFIAYTYGVGRWEGGMLGRGDGSYCGAQIKGTMEHGFLPCDTPGLADAYTNLPQGTASVGREFGRFKATIEKWTAKASPFDLLEAPKCTTAEEGWDLIVNKKVPLQICSGQGFRYRGLDSNGVHIYVAGGSWSHSMQIVAAFGIKSQRYFVIRNQWGASAHKGSPEIGIPGGCMVITYETFDRWVRRSETLGIGQIKGRPSNPGF